MKTKRDLVINQLELVQEVISKTNINIVTCGNCGSVILHKLEDDTITCYDCKSEMYLSDCPDLFYSGMENSALYDDEQVVTTDITVEDVVSVAMQLNLNPSIEEINEVLRGYNDEVENDPTATWELIVENLLYNNIAPNKC